MYFANTEIERYIVLGQRLNNISGRLPPQQYSEIKM